MLGRLLGARYKVINVLGVGGFGHTYIAEDTQRPGNPCCVLKHLTFASNDTSVFNQVRRLFQAEAETLERLGRHDQIPQLLAYFEENREFYLVQEFIEGTRLSDEIADAKKFSEAQVVSLLDDVLGILEYVHNQGVIHRDIKPENLIRRRSDDRFVLIDFGAVKTIGHTIAEATGETNLSVPIYTSGYGASEQCLGRPRFSSDLYSLGIVAIQCLTGMRPTQLPQDFNTSELVWRDQASVSDVVATFLDRMVRYHFMHRYQSATEARQELRHIISDSPTVMHEPLTLTSRTGATVVPSPDTHHQPETRGGILHHKSARQVTLLGGVVLATLAIAALTHYIPLWGGTSTTSNSDPTNPANLPSANALSQRISSGERLLNTWRANEQKQAGIEKLKLKDYQGAVTALQNSWQQDHDPETLIYLNNARIGSSPSYEIAVAVPLDDAALNSAMEILQGVAQVQDETNRIGGIGNKGLKVKIVNDGNNRAIAQQLARSLVADPAVLAVVGHGISDTTLTTAEIYQSSQIVMISPVSSATQLSNMGSFIFRTMPSDRLTAQALVNHMLNRMKKRKAVVFFNSGSDYSKSLKNEFKNAIFYSANLDVLGEFDLSRPDFDAYESVNEAIVKGAEVIMLASDHTTSNQAIQVIQINNNRLKLLSGDSLYSPKLLKVAQQNAVGLVLATPVDLDQSSFKQKLDQFWGKTTPPTWRTALAYDAAQALVTAIKTEPTRAGIQRVLSQPNFSAPGATGKVQFFPESGDRQGSVKLITITPAPSGKSTTYSFKLLQ